MGKSNIEWCDMTWSPVTGCTKIREGCKNCYAERIAKRFWKDRKFTDVQCHPDRLDQPLHWRKPRRIFVCSMSDLFHKDVGNFFINEVWMRMYNNPRHTFIILTKRPNRILNWTKLAAGSKAWPENEIWPDNVWLGVSVSTQKDADELIPILLQIPASKRIVSVEPQLEGICLSSIYLDKARYFETGTLDGIFCGAESGPGRRPFKMEWARNLKNDCVVAGIPFFFKQSQDKYGKVIHMPELDGKVYAEFPEDD